MNKIISEAVETASEIADKIKQSKDEGCGESFPYKTAIIAFGLGAAVAYLLTQESSHQKSK